MAAAIAQTPNLHGPAAARNAARFTTPWALARLTGRGILDGLRAVVNADPLLVGISEQDGSAPPEAARRAAAAAARGELVEVPGGHYAPFLDGHAQAVTAEVSFLRRTLLGDLPAAEPAAAGDGGRARR